MGEKDKTKTALVSEVKCELQRTFLNYLGLNLIENSPRLKMVCQLPPLANTEEVFKVNCEKHTKSK